MSSKSCSWKPAFIAGASSYLFACAFAITLLWPSSAVGQTQCGKRQDFVDQLKTQYGEERRYIATTNSKWLFEVFVSEEGKTWTILVTEPKGTSCIGGAGENWESAGRLPGEKA